MRYPIGGAFDKDEARRIGAEPWMLELLSKNPSYVNWGPHEDCMCDKNGGWRSPLSFQGWSEAHIGLDDLNEVVNFYFEINRDLEECDCGGTGLAPDAKILADLFYYNEFGPGWGQKLTQDEIAALGQEGRLSGTPFANRYKYHAESGECRLKEGCAHPTEQEFRDYAADARICHDAINRFVCVEARCKRLGFTYQCEKCEGHGRTYVGSVRVDLILWVLHPRKGASRGVEIKDIKQSDLPGIFKYLQKAAARNATRFAKIQEAS